MDDHYVWCSSQHHKFDPTKPAEVKGGSRWIHRDTLNRLGAPFSSHFESSKTEHASPFSRSYWKWGRSNDKPAR